MSDAIAEEDSSVAARQSEFQRVLDEMYLIDEAIDPGFPARKPLPLGSTSEGGPVWQPPTTIFYDDLMGESYAKMRKAIMDFTGDDRAKTTEFLDWEIESILDERYFMWAANMMSDLDDCKDEGGAVFFYNLARELCYDLSVSHHENWARTAAIITWHGDEPVVECHDPYTPLWGGDPRIIQKIAEYNEAMDEGVARIKAEQEAADREGVARKRKEMARIKRAAQRTGKPNRKRWRQAKSSLTPRIICSKGRKRPTQAQSRERCVAQDDDEEREEVEWLDSMEPKTSKPMRLRPLILQGIDSCITKHQTQALDKLQNDEDDVD